MDVAEDVDESMSEEEDEDDDDDEEDEDEEEEEEEDEEEEEEEEAGESDLREIEGRTSPDDEEQQTSLASLLQTFAPERVSVEKDTFQIVLCMYSTDIQ